MIIDYLIPCYLIEIVNKKILNTMYIFKYFKITHFNYNI